MRQRLSRPGMSIVVVVVSGALAVGSALVVSSLGGGSPLAASSRPAPGEPASSSAPGQQLDRGDPVDPSPSGRDVLAVPPKGPPAARLGDYRAPRVRALPDLDPGLARRGPRPTLHQLESIYQYGNPTVMYAPVGSPPDWRLQHPDPFAVRGYASQISVTPGSSVGISLAGRDPWANLDLYRIGIGDGRKMLEARHVSIPRGEVDAAPRPSDGLVVDAWPTAYTLTVDPAWPSGVYLLKLTGASGGQSYVLFIVRPVVPGAFTVVIPTMTYQAYNDQGGADLYGWTGHQPARAFAVSYDRPFSRQFGAGLFFRLDFPLVVWLEDHGYHPDYVADVDLARDPTLLRPVTTLAFSGHAEYWTGGMRDAVEAAARAGTNLAFFGANQAFWQARLVPDPAGSPDRVIVCYKSAQLDPVTAANPAAATTRFQQTPVNRPPSALLGQKYGGIVRGVSPMVVGPGISAFAPTIGLHSGERLPGLIGEEVDELHHAFTGIALGQTPMHVTEHGGVILVGATLWLNPLGDRVFDAGTFDYAWGLDPRYASALPGFDARAYAGLTQRILAWLGATPAG